jgi:SAM-dependent methyltransferase
VRPRWPLAAVDAAFDHWGIDPASARVVDVGAGTGRLTERLVERGAQVVAVEPVDAMRARIRGADARAGVAESLPLEDGAADAWFGAQAFHWFDQPAAIAEAARVLRPGGGLCVAWYESAQEAEPPAWRDPMIELLRPHYYSPVGLALDAEDSREHDEWQAGPHWEPFEPIVRVEVEHREEMTRSRLVAITASFSYVAALDEPTRTDLLARVDALLAAHGVERYDHRWRCDLYLTRRR